MACRLSALALPGLRDGEHGDMSKTALSQLYRAQLARAERLLVRPNVARYPLAVALLESVVALRRADLLRLNLNERSTKGAER